MKEVIFMKKTISVSYLDETQKNPIPTKNRVFLAEKTRLGADIFYQREETKKPTWIASLARDEVFIVNGFNGFIARRDDFFDHSVAKSHSFSRLVQDEKWLKSAKQKTRFLISY